VIVVPSHNTTDYTNTPGNYTEGQGSTGAGVIQQLIGSGQFSGLGEIQITEISFRPAAGDGDFSANFGALSVYLSTSPNFPNSLTPMMSTTFGNNVGPDETLVYSSPNASWSGAGCAGPGVCPFDINLVLSTPFNYNPANGQLLLELDFSNYSATNYMDAVMFSSASVSKIEQVVSFGTANPTSGTSAYIGLITQFDYTPSPEPSSWMMLAGGGVLFFGYRKFRQAPDRR
jgi:hypothetical protein